jgi:outer membrane protein assembly factor BamD (BamD/ComL family)
MKKSICLFLIFLFIGSLFIVEGCNFSKNSASSNRQLAGKQKAQAEDWLHSANLLYNVKDYKFALEYYKKVVTYYPGTKYSLEAQKRIDVIEGMDIK